MVRYRTLSRAARCVAGILSIVRGALAARVTDTAPIARALRVAHVAPLVHFSNLVVSPVSSCRNHPTRLAFRPSPIPFLTFPGVVTKFDACVDRSPPGR